MFWVPLLLVVVAFAVMVRGVHLVVAGRRQGRRSGVDAEERMVASLRVVAGVRLLNRGAVLLVLGLVLFLIV